MYMTRVQPWSTAELATLIGIWSVMMAAMMIPSAIPMILTFAGVNRMRGLRYITISTFVLGYLTAWTVFSLAAAVAQTALRSAALISAMGISAGRVFPATVLIATGAFQWTRLKDACLRQCRSPLGFVLTHWREGIAGAYRMGLAHGVYCLGCCWLLMALLFAVGVMNMWWMAVITVFVLIEKTAPAGRWIAKAAGVFLMIWGAGLLARTVI